MNIKSVIQSTGWNGKLLAHVMAWFGEGTHVHRVNRYQSDDPFVVAAQLDNMQALGIDGVIGTWQGATVGPVQTRAYQLFSEMCAERGMLFAFLLDPWLVKGRANTSVSPVQEVINRLNDPVVQEILNAPSYIPEKAILEFDLSSSGVMGANVVDFSQVAKALPQYKFLSKHTGYSWPEITNTLATLQKDNANFTMLIPGVCVQFNDGGTPYIMSGTTMNYSVTTTNWGGLRDYAHSVWDNTTGTRVIDHQGGNTFMDHVASVPKTAPYAAVVTWNDSDEGTDIEKFAVMCSGKRIGK